MHKTKQALALLSLPLALASCGTSAPLPQPTEKEIPSVQRVIAPDDATYQCGGEGSQSQAGLLSNASMLDHGDVYRRGNLGPQWTPETTPGTVQDMLYTSKSLLNKFYYGYSPKNLDELHDWAYNEAKSLYPNHLSTYFIDGQIDPLMYDYIGQIEDNHTYYMDAGGFGDYLASLEGQAAPTPRIGVNYDVVEGVDGAVVTDVRHDGPAFKAGLRRGDVITEINGQPVAGTGLGREELMQKVGDLLAEVARSNQPLPLSFTRAGQPMQITLQGDRLGANMPWGEMLTANDGSQHYYLRVPTFFFDGVAQKAHNLVAEAQAAGAQSIILDLRGNGGGYLKEWVGVAGAFSTEGAGQAVRFNDASESAFSYSDAEGAVRFTYSCQPTQTVFKIQNPQRWNGKLAILVDKQSASSSEMLSKSLDAVGRATVIGEETFGIMDTSNYLFELPGRWQSEPRGLSITYGRVKLNGELADASFVPPVPVKEDRAALAKGDDVMLRTALEQMSAQ